MEDFLEREYFDNTVLEYIIAASIILVGLLIVRILKSFILRKVKDWTATTEGTGDDFFVDAIDRFGIPALYYAVIYSGLNYLNLSPKAESVISIVTAIVITFLSIRLISSVVLLLLKTRIRQQERGEEKIKQLAGLMILINIFIWILGIIFLLDNLGHDVTTMITGLGIGGIAIALAAQNILGDLFNYFVIFFDRPFEVGDFIIVDDKMGTIETIGIKTTRIRSLSGEQLVIGNSNLANSRIHNYKRLAQRRVVFSLDVEYGTPIEKLQRIPEMIKGIILQNENVRFDRAHFASYKDWSLRFEVVYFVLSADYNIYMDIQQEINLKLYQAFEEEEIPFAFPTQKTIGGLELVRQEVSGNGDGMDAKRAT